MKLDSKAPKGPLEQKWQKHKKEMKLVAPNNRRKYEIIIVGTGLAGGAEPSTDAGGEYIGLFALFDVKPQACNID